VGVQLGMAFGEAPARFVTPNLQLVVASSLVTNTRNLSISTPSATSPSYGRIPQKLVLGPTGLSVCAYSSGYAQLSALEWSSNPYNNSKAIGSPLLRLSAVNQAKVAAVKLKSLAQGVNKTSVKFVFDKVPAYTISLQFSSIQSFNFTASRGYDGKSHSTSNFTIPACTLYNGTAYVPCKGCKISSYTNHNVTYGCFDITQLCPTSTTTRKVIGAGGQGGGPIFEGTSEVDEEEEESVESTIRRSLGAKPTESETASTYGMLIQSVIAELRDVLSSNPFALDPSKSIVVLTFMGILTGGIIIIILYLLGLDRTDLLHKSYVQREYDAATRKHIEYDIKHGGNGDLGEAYQQYSNKFRSDKAAQASVMSSINRTRIKIGMHRTHARIDYDEANPGKALEAAKSQFTSIDAATLKYADADDSSSADGDSDLVAMDDQHTIAAVVTEFFHKLFPGRSIFVDKEDNVGGTVFTYHKYFCMFAGSELPKTRAIRFLNVVALILTAVFADTVFFGIYFPAESRCKAHQDQVRENQHVYINKSILSLNNVPLNLLSSSQNAYSYPPRSSMGPVSACGMEKRTCVTQQESRRTTPSQSW
jgi:hypothetical protein